MTREQTGFVGDETDFRALALNMSDGFAHCRLITDCNGVPCDIAVLSFNPAIEKITGLDFASIVGKPLCATIPAFAGSPWRDDVIRIAVEGGAHVSERHSPVFGKWFRMTIYGERKGEFSMILRDCTAERNEKELQRQKEEKEFQAKKDILFLEESAMTFVKFPSNADIFDYIAAKIHGLAPECYVAVNSFDSAETISTTRAFYGIGHLVDKLLVLFGGHPVGKTYAISDRLYKPYLTSGKIELFPVGLYELAFRQIPQPVCAMIESLLNIDRIFGAGFSREGAVYGNVVIIPPRGREIPNTELIGAFINQAAVALQRKRAEEMIRESEYRYKLLVETATDVIYTVSREGLVTSMNDAVEAATGWKKEEIIGKPFTFLMHPDDIRYAVDNHRIHNEGERPVKKEFRFRCRSGEYITAEFATAPLIKDGKVIGRFGIARDITERKKAQEELLRFNSELERRVAERTADLDAARAGAEAATLAKSEFIANMSHEIRTPLNGIIGFANLLSNQISDGKLRSYISAINSNSASLLRLINDILDISRIEAGKLTLDYAPTSLSALLREMSNVFSLRALEKNLEISIEDDPGLPRFLMLDEARVRQILFNLIGNAMKFTERGSIRLYARSVAADPAAGRADISIGVSDSGIGIAPDAIGRIFEAFSQADPRASQRYGGAGLGLSITKRLAESMGGRVTVTSELEKGSTFEVFLPDVEISPTDGRPATAEIDYEDIRFEKASLLLVDDVEDNRGLLREFFSGQALEVIEAENGAAALELMRTAKPDVVLMDVKMPVMNGYDATRAIKADERLRDVPVIALTASAMKHDDPKLAAAGFDGCLTKPFEFAALMKELSRFLKYSAGERDGSVR